MDILTVVVIAHHTLGIAYERTLSLSIQGLYPKLTEKVPTYCWTDKVFFSHGLNGTFHAMSNSLKTYHGNSTA